MNRYRIPALGTLGLIAAMAAPLHAAPATLLSKPDDARGNVAASPKLDDRVYVYTAAAISSSILEHAIDSQEIMLDVGARDGVRFGHAFQIVAQNSTERIGVAKVIELQARRCVAKVITLDQDRATQSVKGFTAVCMAPKSNKRTIVIQCAFGKSVWQTESLENKLIRGLLEGGGDQVQILIREENSDLASAD